MELPSHKFKSVYRQYIHYTVIFPFILLSITAVISLLNYRAIEKEHIARYSNEANRVTASLSDTFQYMEYCFRIIGNKIAQANSDDPEVIATILKNKIEPALINEDVTAWSQFDFVLPNGDDIASSTIGVMPKSVKVTASKRPWMITAPKNPWKIQFASPDIGLVSGEWVIPVGYGVTNKEGTFLGIISLGFNLKKITKKLQQSLVSLDTDFVVLDQDYHLIVASSEEVMHADNTLTQQLAGIHFAQNDGKLAHPVNVNDITFRYYHKMSPYPYLVLVGSNKIAIYNELRRLVLPQIIQTVTLGGFFLLLLFFFRKNIIAPIVKLSDSALVLADGRTDVTIPRGNNIETDNLATSLERVKTMIKNEHYFMNELTLANSQVKAANETLEQKVIERTSELQRALQAKTEFLNNISHEMRVPVHGVMNYSEILVENWQRLDEQKRRDIAGELYESSKRLNLLVNNLLDLSKFTAGKMSICVVEADLAAITLSVFHDCKSLYLNKKDLTLELEEPQCSTIAIFDKDRIMQVIRNLVSNAIKFTESGTITARINMQMYKYGQKWVEGIRFSLTDEGKGVPEGELQDIFSPFTQSSRTKTGAGGTGLGLSISAEIIDSHKGWIWAENNVGKLGSTFSFIIPVEGKSS